MLIDLLVLVAFGVALVWAVTALFLKGRDLSAFDGPVGERFSSGPEPSAELKTVVASLSVLGDALRQVPLKQRIPALRRTLDEMFAGRELDATFTPVECAGVPAEWVLAPGADGAAARSTSTAAGSSSAARGATAR